MTNATDPIYTIADILKSTNYALEVFESEEIEAIELFDKKNKPYLKDFVDGKDRLAKPEEIVRQLYIYCLIHTYRYPIERISVAKAVYFGSTVANKKADIVICDRDDPDTAYIIVEVKVIIAIASLALKYLYNYRKTRFIQKVRKSYYDCWTITFLLSSLRFLFGKTDSNYISNL